MVTSASSGDGQFGDAGDQRPRPHRSGVRQRRPWRPFRHRLRSAHGVVPACLKVLDLRWGARSRAPGAIDSPKPSLTKGGVEGRRRHQ